MTNKLVPTNKKSKIYNLLLVIFFSVIFFNIIILTHDLGYQTNDDIIISDFISGRFTGTPSIHGVFIMFPLTIIMKILYSIFNKIDWYPIIMMLLEMIF